MAVRALKAGALRFALCVLAFGELGLCLLCSIETAAKIDPEYAMTIDS